MFLPFCFAPSSRAPMPIMMMLSCFLSSIVLVYSAADSMLCANEFPENPAYSFLSQCSGSATCGPDEIEVQWDDLASDRQQYYQELGWTKERWESKDPSLQFDWGRSFNPAMVNLSIPELEKIDFEYLNRTMGQLRVELRDGDTIGEDELTPREYLSMQEFLVKLQEGSKLYLKYDDRDEFKKSIHSTIGLSTLKHLRDALKAVGRFPSELEGMEFTLKNWSFWVGGTNTSTGMHYDADDFVILWVATGRKRIVMVPNDERTALNYSCATNIEGFNHSCWTNVDILNGPLPPFGVEFELGPGDGIIIPAYCWHAVQNLEPTIAFGLQRDYEDY